MSLLVLYGRDDVVELSVSGDIFLVKNSGLQVVSAGGVPSTVEVSESSRSAGKDRGDAVAVPNQAQEGKQDLVQE